MEKTKKFYINIILTLLILGLFLMYFTYRFQTESETKVLNTLTEISEQSVRVVEGEVENNKKLLVNLATLLAEQNIKEPDKLIEMLTPVDLENGFKRMGVIFEGGKGYTTTEEIVQLDNEQLERFAPAMAGKTVITDTLDDISDHERVTVYSTPILFKDGSRCVLFGTYSTEYYRDILSVSSFEGSGYTYVIKQNGNCIVGSSNELAMSFDNFYEQNIINSNTNKAVMNKLKTAIEKREQGILKYDRGESERYLYYQPLMINDWYLLSVIPVSVVEERVNGMLLLAYALVASCTVALIYLAYRIISMNNKHHRDVDRMLFIDEITGHDSKIKFNMDVLSVLEKNKKGYAVVCFDVRKFQYINDLYGYEEGNKVLKKIMETLVNHLESGEFATRFQSDQFVALLKFQNEEMLRLRVIAILKEIQTNTDNRQSEMPYQVKMLAGIYLIEDHNTSLQTMIDRANTALRSGYENFAFCTFYDAKIRNIMLLNKNIEDTFEDALKNNELKVFIQPKFDVQKNTFDGGEALVRWQKNGQLWQSPAVFIPVLEKSGQIIDLDEYIFHEVCLTIRQWMDLGYEVAPISINVSMLHLYRMDFVDNYMRIINQYQIPTALVQLEMTETAMFTNTTILIDILGRFRKEGIHIQMDDFGSGYSSVSMLQHMPIDILKIDKSLIDEVEKNEKGKRILEISVILAHSLDLKVVAEGVENKEQFHVVKEIGIDYVQGYYCAKPMPLNEYEKKYVKAIV